LTLGAPGKEGGRRLTNTPATLRAHLALAAVPAPLGAEAYRLHDQAKRWRDDRAACYGHIALQEEKGVLFLLSLRGSS